MVILKVGDRVEDFLMTSFSGFVSSLKSSITLYLVVLISGSWLENLDILLDLQKEVHKSVFIEVLSISCLGSVLKIICNYLLNH